MFFEYVHNIDDKGKNFRCCDVIIFVYPNSKCVNIGVLKMEI